jgi:hypothetical protein
VQRPGRVEHKGSRSCEEIFGQFARRLTLGKFGVRLTRWWREMDFATKTPLPLGPEEASAHVRLKRAFAGEAAPTSVTVTGTLLNDEHGFYLELRGFTL